VIVVVNNIISIAENETFSCLPSHSIYLLDDMFGHRKKVIIVFVSINEFSSFEIEEFYPASQLAEKFDSSNFSDFFNAQLITQLTNQLTDQLV